MTDFEAKKAAFLDEFRELLKKYNANIWADMDGDTHGVTASIMVDLDNKTVLNSGIRDIDWNSF